MQFWWNKLFFYHHMTDATYNTRSLLSNVGMFLHAAQPEHEHSHRLRAKAHASLYNCCLVPCRTNQKVCCANDWIEANFTIRLANLTYGMWRSCDINVEPTVCLNTRQRLSITEVLSNICRQEKVKLSTRLVSTKRSPSLWGCCWGPLEPSSPSTTRWMIIVTHVNDTKMMLFSNDSR